MQELPCGSCTGPPGRQVHRAVGGLQHPRRAGLHRAHGVEPSGIVKAGADPDGVEPGGAPVIEPRPHTRGVEAPRRRRRARGHRHRARDARRLQQGRAALAGAAATLRLDQAAVPRQRDRRLRSRHRGGRALLDPISREGGLLAVGAAAAAITPSGFDSV